MRRLSSGLAEWMVLALSPQVYSLRYQMFLDKLKQRQTFPLSWLSGNYTDFTAWRISARQRIRDAMLDAPPVVVGSRNWITPADEVEDAFFPYPSDILDAVHEHMLPLPGYTPARGCSAADLMRRSAGGI